MKKVVTVRFWLEVPEDEVEHWRNRDVDITSDEFIKNDVTNMVSGFNHFYDYSDILKIEIMEIQNEKCISV